MKVVFFGTPELAAQMLSSLAQVPGVDIVAVVTQPDRARGRSGKLQPPPVKVAAQALSLPIYQPARASAPEFIDELRQLDANLFVVVAYGEILKQDVLDIPNIACINVHFSLLPQYRGAAPMQHSLMHGDRQSGCTVIHMTKRMDAGDVIGTQACQIGPNTTRQELEQQLTQIGTQLLLEIVKAAKRDGKLVGVPQNPEDITFAPKIETADCRIDWSRPAQDLHNLVRAVTGQPGAWCMMQHGGRRQRLKILRSEVVEQEGEPAHCLCFDKNDWIIGCGAQALRLLEVQAEGKKAMPAASFIAGARGEEPEILLDGN